MMQIQFRPETPDDYFAVESLTREAFWGYMGPTCDEHYLVHLLRDSAAFVPELDIVAEVDGKLAGHIMFSKAKVMDKEGIAHEVLTFGPLSVLPEFRNRGVGSALMRHTIPKAREMGYSAIIIFGHPDYYPRFGFVNANRFGITTPDGKNFDALMAMPLFDGALSDISGVFIEDPAFEINAEDAKAYDKRFPHKEPAAMTPISVLLNFLPPEAAKAFIDHGFENLQMLTTVSGREMLSWEGVGENAMETVNRTLAEHGLPGKLLPTSPILQLAEMGIQC